MKNEKKTYFIKSNKNGLYLSCLFVDTHDEMFQASRPELGIAYGYNVKQIAQDIANNENGTVVESK